MGLIAGSVAAKEKPRDAKTALDHLLLGTADLDEGIRLVKEKTGLSPVIGGSHPGVGTRNALLSLGHMHYLEIIAPDPGQKDFRRSTDIRKLREPRLIGWAVATNNIAAVATQASQAGIRAAGPQDGSRRKPDGTMLRWQTLHAENDFASASVEPVPFFIQWGEGTLHPSRDAVTSCRVETIELQHPRSAELAEFLRKLGIAATVRQGAEPRISAALRTPRGKWLIK